MRIKKYLFFLKRIREGGGGGIIKEVVARRPKTYAYLMDDDTDHKKAKGTKKCVIK